MSAANSFRQRGSTLLVAMIMLVVLTLLVVFAIRSGNTNLRIAGNMQAESEVTAATQVAIEQVIEQIKTAPNISMIPEQKLEISVGPRTYTVVVQAMKNCLNDAIVPVASLDPNARPADQSCMPDSSMGQRPICPNGLPCPGSSACKLQNREIIAGVTDSLTGAQSTQVQGIKLRVPGEVDCES